MFTRRAVVNVEPGSAAEAGRIFDGEVIPLLHGQRGVAPRRHLHQPAFSEAVLNGVRDGATGGRMNREVGNYDEDNKGGARFEGDDVGLPESPIYSNFSKNLWRTHEWHSLVQSPNRSGEDTSGHRPTLGGS